MHHSLPFPLLTHEVRLLTYTTRLAQEMAKTNRMHLHKMHNLPPGFTRDFMQHSEKDWVLMPAFGCCGGGRWLCCSSLVPAFLCWLGRTLVMTQVSREPSASSRKKTFRFTVIPLNRTHHPPQTAKQISEVLGPETKRSMDELDEEEKR